MIVLQAQNLSKSYGVDLIFREVSFIVEMGDKMALVGPNGAGKSTLLKCLVGEESLDEGQVTMGRGVSYGYLSQTVSLEDLESSAFELVMEAFQDLVALRQELRETERLMSDPAVYGNENKLNKAMGIYATLTARYEMEGGYTFEARVREVLTGLGFAQAEWERPVRTFSGGQKTRLALARLLAREPDLLLLDEPTNYLDLDSLEWLESFLKQYRGAVLVVSHDRYFLDAVVEQVLELEHHRLKSYKGNYSEYAVKKAREEAAAQKAYEMQEARIARLTAYIDRYRAGIKARQARGRETQLAKMLKLEKPKERSQVKIKFNTIGSSGNQVLLAKDVTFGYEGRPLFTRLNLELWQGDKVAVVGANGTGKTTLLKLILGELKAETGSISFGSRVKWAYFAQEGETLSPNNTVLGELLADADLTLEEARSHLARFLFRNDELDKKVGTLSGGERSRLALAKLMLIKANLLILDEPTNHLDMETRQVLEDALTDFDGTLFLVSHDRYFINQVANQVWELEEGRLNPYLGDYDYYRWKKEEIKKRQSQDNQEKKQIRTVKEPRPVKKKEKSPDPQALEERIMEVEARLEELAAVLGDEALYADGDNVKRAQTEYEQLELELAELYDSWEKALEAQ
jgi:ATP-binding cassette subfamily F protein 3